ncbi:MAG: hypothetical protein V1922_05350 [bacterium]
MLQLDESHSMLHAFCVKPGIKFENQKGEEEVLLSLRAHPIILVPTFVNSIVMVILIFFSSFILGQFLTLPQLIYTMVFFFFATFVYFWFQIINWYFNIGIVTNKQIVDVDFSALSYRNVTRTELTHIEDITVKVSGFISSIFDYGNVFVQTAGSEINTEFMQVPHPARAAHIIQDILKQYATTE